MRTVRVFFEKLGRLKFTSHLDLNRFMDRIMVLSKVPMWYTEGFNPHPYITFALPLSLGFESKYEIMDFRVIDDSFTNEMVKEALEKVVPKYIKIIKVADPVEKTGKIGYAEYRIECRTEDTSLKDELDAFLSQSEIIVEKKTKKGNIKSIDIAPKIENYRIEFSDNLLTLYITLPAGGEDNINPNLVLNAFGKIPYYSVLRTCIYNLGKEIFM